MSIIMLILIGFLFRLTSARDYCKLCENGTHTMCRYENGPGKSCIDYKKVELTSGDKKYIVDIHNDIRNHVASGQESKGTLGSQPPAADMLLLQWDNELAEIAQRWADQCIQLNSPIQHDICKRTERFEVGQNILTAMTTDPELPELSVLILNWYKQVANVIPSDVDYFIGIRRGKFLIGQYTQLVWAKTRYVGCGIAAFKESNSVKTQNELYHHRLVCNYGPAGNIIGQAVYQRGMACSKCPDRKCDSVRTNLCLGLRKNANDTTTISFTKETSSQTNSIIFTNSSITFNTKINSSLCLNPDEINNTTNVTKYTKCIVGIGTNTNATNSTAFDTSATSSTLRPIKINNFTYTTSAIPPIPENISVWDTTVDKPTTIFYLRQAAKTESDKKIIIITTQANYIDSNYALENETGIVFKYRHHYLPVVDTAKRMESSNHIKPVIATEDEIVLPNNQHYLKAKGTWQNGHCRCDRIYRSHSEILKPTYFPLLSTLFVYLHTNIL